MTKVKDAIYWRMRYKKLNIRYIKLEAKYFRLKARMLQGKPLKESSFPQHKEVDWKRKYYNLLSRYKALRAKQLEKWLE